MYIRRDDDDDDKTLETELTRVALELPYLRFYIRPRFYANKKRPLVSC